ncbi:MAG: hypothetical protein CO129_11120 [Ignavibacteriales bacterium CG_4_9_14_3_um_filter_34_10]|nr:MAG: hypothetical protein CO129_11120 [Ignavibacteriales bacterium CG_4_9_14_3_um_filter_34_10]
MKTITKIILTFSIIFIASNVFSQGIPEPLYKDIYPFLSSLAQKGLIEFNDEIRPLSREYVFDQLKIINEKLKIDPKLNLTELEKQELKFYMQDYNIEPSTKYSNDISFLPAAEKSKAGPGDCDEPISNPLSNKQINNSTNQPKLFDLDLSQNYFRLFTYSNNIIRLNLDPIFGLKFGTRDGSSYKHFYNGVRLYGYLSDNVSFSFDFRDNSESGDKLDVTKSFTPTTGIIRSLSEGNSFQYSEVRTSISYSWKWGSITAAKDFINWGYGKSGLIVMSDKAPSFPLIRLDLHPADWLSFNYFHAWLSSDVVDSNEIYQSYRKSSNYDRILYREKYLASHTITIYPYSGISVSLGESVVYSDRLEFAYMFPLMFFRAADHYLSRKNNSAGANSQFFFGISSRNNIKNTHLYASLIIDEIALSNMFDSKRQRNQIAFSLGASVVDLPIDNLKLTVEYTRINPFVYRHYIPTQTFTNHGYLLGHWMGHNSDMIYGSLEYKILRGLKSELWLRHIRKGGDGLVDDQYTLPSKPFLFGLRNNYTDFGFELSYQFFHDIFAKIIWQSNSISSEYFNGLFSDSKKNEIYFSINYGF